MVRSEAQGLVWQSAVSLCAEKELGAKDFRLGRDQGSMLPGRFLSRQTPPYHPPVPSLPPALSLQVATSPCQVLMLFWNAEPAS